MHLSDCQYMGLSASYSTCARGGLTHMNIKELVPEKVESEINSPDHPTRRFVGFALLLAWHYNLWFLHDSFVGAQLLDDCVTQS